MQNTIDKYEKSQKDHENAVRQQLADQTYQQHNLSKVQQQRIEEIMEIMKTLEDAEILKGYTREKVAESAKEMKKEMKIMSQRIEK